jgi:hypothetical protein
MRVCVSQGPGSHLPAWGSSRPPHAPMAPAPGSGQLQGCHVSPWLRLLSPSYRATTCPRGSGSRLSALGLSRIPMAPAPAPASRLGVAPGLACVI